jgi:hypothetical protein
LKKQKQTTAPKGATGPESAIAPPHDTTSNQFMIGQMSEVESAIETSLLQEASEESEESEESDGGYTCVDTGPQVGTSGSMSPPEGLTREQYSRPNRASRNKYTGSPSSVPVVTPPGMTVYEPGDRIPGSVRRWYAKNGGTDRAPVQTEGRVYPSRHPGEERDHFLRKPDLSGWHTMTRTHMNTPEEQNATRVTVDKGQLRWKGAPLDTEGAEPALQQSGADRMLYAMQGTDLRVDDAGARNRELGGAAWRLARARAETREKEKEKGSNLDEYPELEFPKYSEHFHHTSLFAGEAVSAAGDLEVRQGRLVKITNTSGHYKPDTLGLVQALESLRELKADLGATRISVMGADGEKERGDYSAERFLQVRGQTQVLDAHDEAMKQIRGRSTPGPEQSSSG